MVMTAYLDESGTHGASSPLTTVAGFIGTAEQWMAYEHAVTELFAEFKVQTFHAIDFRRTKGDFKGWKLPQKAKFNSRFLKLADDHLTAGISMILGTGSYDAIYRSGTFPRKARPDTKYGLCVRSALWKAIVLLVKRKTDWPLNVVLETGNVNAGDAIRVFAEVQESLTTEYASLLGCLSFASKKGCLPLALADSFAYSIFRMTAGYSAHPTEPNACIVGPADPPYYVSKIQMSRTLIDDNTLDQLRRELGGSLSLET